MRKFKPAKPVKVSGKKKEQLRQVLFEWLPTGIPLLRNYDEAVQLETDLWGWCKLGLLSDSEYNGFVQQINEVCKNNNWAKP